jgi:hypothetical protein
MRQAADERPGQISEFLHGRFQEIADRAERGDAEHNDERGTQMQRLPEK